MVRSAIRVLFVLILAGLMACKSSDSSTPPPPPPTPVTPTISGFSPAAIVPGGPVSVSGTHLTGATKVQFNGADATAFTVASDSLIQATAPATLTAGVITVTTPNGTATSAAYTVASNAATVQVLMNQDFEQATPIIWQGDTGIIQGAPGSSSPSVVPHGGTLFAWLGGYGAVASDQITQDAYIPATATAATATFYMKILTAETATTIKDTVSVDALSAPSGASLGNLLTLSNLNASADYVQRSVDLMPFKGQVVRLSFKSQEDAQNPTSFLLDDVALNIQVPNTSDLKPLISTFTPTTGTAGETTIQISGGNFFGLTAVTVGGASASYTLTDGTSLSASVPPGAAVGSAPIAMTNVQGTGTSSSNFTVAYAAPAITSVNPTAGPVGTPVVITGTHLGYPGTTVSLNGGSPITPTQLTSTQITFNVPAGATSGPLVVTTLGGTASSTFTVNGAGSTLDLHVEKAQLTQSTQTLDNTVPIVAGKDGLARIFVLANQANTATPSVQITLLNNGVAVPGYPKTVAAPGASVPLALDEGTLGASWNLFIPGTDLTTPTGTGYSLRATVDPANAIPESDETNNTTTVQLAGTTVPMYKTTIFPVVLTAGNGNVTEANKAQWVARLAKMYPVASMDVQVGSAFTPSVSSVTSDGTGWDTILNDLTAKHLTDAATASDRYYFGAMHPGYTSGVIGLGWVPSVGATPKWRTAIGWDSSGYQDGANFPETFAHETGHNMGRNHSPCPTGANAPASPDPNYPYAAGAIGVWGCDTTTNPATLKSPTAAKDVMSYCFGNIWVSDYTYKGILDFRNATGGFLVAGAEDAPLPKAQTTARECLIVRGIVHRDGTVTMLPSLRTRALPSAVPATGEFTVAFQDAGGALLHEAPLELMELGCGPKQGEHHFVMALPLDPAVLAALSEIRILRKGQVQASLQAASAAVTPAAPELRRLSPDRLQVTWDATVQPTVLIRDQDTDEVIAILSGGRQVIPAKGRHFEVSASDGVASRTHHLVPAE